MSCIRFARWHNEIFTNILHHPVVLFVLIWSVFNNYVQHNTPVKTAVTSCFLVYCMVLYLRLYSVTVVVISE
jgi:hypothetical protein